MKTTKNQKSIFYTELLFIKSAIQYVQSDYLESRNSYEELFNISKEIHNEVGIARALNGRGLIHLGRELFNEALIEIKKALVINRKIAHQKSIAANLLNIGICYQELGEWEDAYTAYHESYKISIRNDLEIYALMDMNRLGSLFLEKNQLDSAEYYLLKVYDSKSNQWEKSYNLSGLTELEFKKENYTKAIEYGLKSFEIAKEIGAKWDASEVALKLSKTYEKINLLQKALEYHKIHKAYSDSLLNEEMNHEINWAELQQSKAENEQLKVQKNLLSSDKDRNQLIIALLASLVLFLVILALLYRRHIRQKEKYNQNLGAINRQLADKKLQIEKQNEELKQINNAKNRLFSILSHDLRSPINSVKQLLEIRGSISEDDNEKFMNRLTQEVGNVNQQINRLLKWANTQMDGFKTNPKVVQLEKTVDENLNSIKYIAQEKGIELKHNIAKSFVYMDPEQLNIIINNLLNNSIKFTPTGGFIEVNYSQNDTSIFLSIEDNGIGMDQNTLASLKGELNERSFSRKGTAKEIGTGLGMLLVKQFLTFNNAFIEIESEEGKGTRFILTFPKATEGI
ncbi:tetratricopeptide repeat-containing sensor histidine kinase [Marivirga salinae]|uniref:histidine kinase n=1 Tax=Marivirga salinarum TaxID=3059078 RepID=A0AA51N8X8_9BACT|nr:tetratricopeptide repeat-containing sensor histidine kinase [Marivirga sp. BDSF4-3]WMN10857.1 tetratricopeptide repeat-containing sensor histidine kinase [Marivirga sp. BDSF4-3]